MAFASVYLILLLLPICAVAQNNGTVPIGSRITAHETARPWLSPSGDFAFGFQKLQDQDLFLLSIWYNNIPAKTIAWFVNSIDPVPQGSTVELNATDGLVLRDPRGRQIWNPDGIAAVVDHGFMNDTGNFVLKSSNNTWVWESFHLPSDTILPSQQLDHGSVLISRKSETDFSTGRFYLRFLDNGNLVLATRSVRSNTQDDYEYYNSQTADSVDARNSGERVIFDERGFLYVLRRNSERFPLTPPTIPQASENYYRATLSFDGVFIQYFHPRTFTGTPNWNSVWNAPDNICMGIIGDKGSGACGYNSVCRLGDSGRPVCECPPGFELVDPNDQYGSCDPNFTLSCRGAEPGRPEELYDFLVIKDTDWPLSDYQQIMPSNEETCRQACLQDCFCAVAIFRSNSCWKKKLPLSNGRIDLSLNAITFMKFPKSDIPRTFTGTPNWTMVWAAPDNKCMAIIGDQGSGACGYNSVCSHGASRILITVVSALLGSSVFINIILIAAACRGFIIIYGMKKIRNDSAKETNLLCFTFKELAEATNGFKEELGRGSFGIVYKGVIMVGNSRSILAVKKLDRVERDSEKEFCAEVNAIGKTHHKNLVDLIGFCDEGHHRLLVYECMSNGALSSFLFSNPKPSWSLRTQIAIGIARGLTYLHEECGTQIIHCDIKPQNILLDDHYNARISDFGLVKLLEFNKSRTSTKIRGTKGYVAPEWFRNTPISAKVDVYSFGVMLLEVISCRRSLEDVEACEGGNAILIEWVWDCVEEGRLDALVGDDVEALDDRKKLERFVMVGIWCIQENSSMRPTMRKVSQMLEGVVEVMVPPCPFPSSLSTC